MHQPVPSALTLLIALAPPMLAQSPPKTSIHFGETIRMSLKTFFFNMQIIGRDETGLYGMQTPPTEIFGKANVGGIRHYHLARYDHNTLDNPETIKMTFEDSEGERKYEFATQIGDQIYIFTSLNNPKLRKTFLFAETVSKNPFGLNRNAKKIAEVTWSKETHYERSNFEFAFSPDNSKMMIRYALMDNNSQVLQFGVCAFDNTLQPLWQSDLNIPAEKESFFNFKKFHIDNKGEKMTKKSSNLLPIKQPVTRRCISSSRQEGGTIPLHDSISLRNTSSGLSGGISVKVNRKRKWKFDVHERLGNNRLTLLHFLRTELEKALNVLLLQTSVEKPSVFVFW